MAARIRRAWFYDLRTNKHFTLKTRTLKSEDLQDFIACYHPKTAMSAWPASVQILQLRRAGGARQGQPGYLLAWDDSLDNLDDLPPPDVLQQEIIEHLEAALAAFRDVAAALPGR